MRNESKTSRIPKSTLIYGSAMPECFRLSRRFAAEARSPSASPVHCTGYDGANRVSRLTIDTQC
jgi:hypothetical protein